MDRLTLWASCPPARYAVFHRPVAQLAERLSPKQEVVGSIPAWPAFEINAGAQRGVF
jgi:hypothetical protein